MGKVFGGAVKSTAVAASGAAGFSASAAATESEGSVVSDAGTVWLSGADEVSELHATSNNPSKGSASQMGMISRFSKHKSNGCKRSLPPIM
jgi:hypothetical protein